MRAQPTLLSMNRSVLILGIVIVALVAVAGIAYAVVVTNPTRTAQPAGTTGPMESAETSAPAIPPPDPLSPKHTSIPGCVCHSDSPKLVEEHAEYRLNQCFACHNGEMPTGQE